MLKIIIFHNRFSIIVFQLNKLLIRKCHAQLDSGFHSAFYELLNQFQSGGDLYFTEISYKSDFWFYLNLKSKSNFYTAPIRNTSTIKLFTYRGSGIFKIKSFGF